MQEVPNKYAGLKFDLCSRGRNEGDFRIISTLFSGTVEYDVPVMKVQEYTLEDIFSKACCC